MSQCHFHPYFRAYNPLSAFNRIGTSISRWCSSDCECPLPRPQRESQSAEPSFLFVTQEEGFTLEPGQAFPFSGRAVVSGDCFLCEEEVIAYWNMSECKPERCCRPRRPCRRKCGRECPEFALCCLPIIDVEESTELCMCGACDTGPDRSECYNFENGIIYLAPGIYLLEYDILLPGDPNAGNPVNTEVHLAANGATIPGSSRTIAHSGETTETVQVRVLYEATEPTGVSLVSTNAMTLTPTMAGEQLVTLAINGLC